MRRVSRDLAIPSEYFEGSPWHGCQDIADEDFQAFVSHQGSYRQSDVRQDQQEQQHEGQRWEQRRQQWEQRCHEQQQQQLLQPVHTAFAEFVPAPPLKVHRSTTFAAPIDKASPNAKPGTLLPDGVRVPAVSHDLKRVASDAASFAGGAPSVDPALPAETRRQILMAFADSKRLAKMKISPIACKDDGLDASRHSIASASTASGLSSADSFSSFMTSARPSIEPRSSSRATDCTCSSASERLGSPFRTGLLSSIFAQRAAPRRGLLHAMTADES